MQAIVAGNKNAVFCCSNGRLSETDFPRTLMSGVYCLSNTATLVTF
jgi:hypothetical protein